MDLQVSSRVAARLVVALTTPKLSPVAKAASKHEPRLRSLIVKSAKATRDAVPMRELESVLIFGGSGAPLYVLEDVLKAWERELLGDGVEPAPTDWIRMRAASKSKQAHEKALYDGDVGDSYQGHFDPYESCPACTTRMRAAANKNDLPSVLNAALVSGAGAAEVCALPSALSLSGPDLELYNRGFGHGQTGYGFQKDVAGRKGSRGYKIYRRAYDDGVDAGLRP